MAVRNFRTAVAILHLCLAERLDRHCRSGSAAALGTPRDGRAGSGAADRTRRGRLRCGRSRPRLDSGRQPSLRVTCGNEGPINLRDILAQKIVAIIEGKLGASILLYYEIDSRTPL